MIIHRKRVEDHLSALRRRRRAPRKARRASPDCWTRPTHIAALHHRPCTRSCASTPRPLQAPPERLSAVDKRPGESPHAATSPNFSHAPPLVRREKNCRRCCRKNSLRLGNCLAIHVSPDARITSYLRPPSYYQRRATAVGFATTPGFTRTAAPHRPSGRTSRSVWRTGQYG